MECCRRPRRNKVRSGWGGDGRFARPRPQPIVVCSFFNERLQPRQRLIPLSRYEIEILFDSCNRLRIEFEKALAAPADAVHNPCALQHTKMLGDRLPSQIGTVRQLRDRIWLPETELRHQRQTRLVAQCGKNGCSRFSFYGCAVTTFL